MPEKKFDSPLTYKDLKSYKTDCLLTQNQEVSYNATTRGYDINVSISGALPSTSILKVFPGDRVIGVNATKYGVTLWSISLTAGSIGSVLFTNTWAAPAEWNDLTVDGMGASGLWRFQRRRPCCNIPD